MLKGNLDLSQATPEQVEAYIKKMSATPTLLEGVEKPHMDINIKEEDLYILT